MQPVRAFRLKCSFRKKANPLAVPKLNNFFRCAKTVLSKMCAWMLHSAWREIAVGICVTEFGEGHYLSRDTAWLKGYGYPGRVMTTFATKGCMK